MYEAEGVNEEGAIVFRTKRAHALDYIPRTAPRAGIGVDSGLATKSNSGEKYDSGNNRYSSARDLPPEISRQWSLALFTERHEKTYGPGRIVEEAWPERNIHSDAEAAQREGLSAPVGSAPQFFP
jgi:hypothetical protein